MTNVLRFPLDIQHFAEGDGGDPTPSPTPATPTIDYDKLADVVSKRSSGTEDKVLQGYFKSQGLTPEQASEAMNVYKQTQATKQQEEAQKIQNIQNENAQLKAQIQNAQVDTTITEQASALGVQADKMPFLHKIVDREKALNEDGTVNVDNIKKSIEDTLKAFPDFKTTSQAGGFQQIGAPAGGNGGNGVEDQLDAIFGIKKK